MHFQEKYLLAENIFPLKAGNWLIRVFSGGWESSLDAGWREAWASGKRLLNIGDLLRQCLGGLAENVGSTACAPGKFRCPRLSLSLRPERKCAPITGWRDFPIDSQAPNREYYRVGAGSSVGRASALQYATQNPRSCTNSAVPGVFCLLGLS